MKPFDLLNDSLEGINLIEAGAGTGKTFTIAGLFLRLIVEQGLGPDRILVVTYTKAATEELKHRIRRRLTSAKHIFGGGRSDDPWLKAWAEKVPDHELALRRISDALVEFDRAAIFTIHGFCQRMLQQFAFETGHRFQSELVQDLSFMTQEIADDFWRRYISKAPDELAAYILDQLKGPEGLAALLNACRYPRIRFWPRAQKPKLSAIAPWRTLTRRIVEDWPLVRETVIPLLHSPALMARSYGKCAQAGEPAEASARGKRIAELAAAMDFWPGTYPLFDQFILLGSARLAAATKKNHQTPEHSFFDLCQEVSDQQALMEEQLSRYLRFLKLTLLHRAAHQLDAKKARRNQISFDDLLLNVARALSDGRSAGLVRSTREQYAAALVDEFQDTDPLQYKIFMGLFGTEPGRLFMIGDPKQAIYSFRGADVFAYLHASRKASRQYTLERNWRATPDLITAVNTIFSNRPHPFGMPEISFTPARPGHEIDPEQGQGNSKNDPSLFLWYLESAPSAGDKAVGKPLAQYEATQRIVEAVAARIVDLLCQSDAPAAEQIAVLTRSHHQAQLVKAALSRRQVPAVLYSAGRVFDTNEAQELMRVLRAVITPGNPLYVRAALATEMMGCQARDFEEGSSGEPAAWEARWERFEDYHRQWGGGGGFQGGFSRMFGCLMRREHVKAGLLGLAEGERRITNLLHLAELLQKAEIEERLGPEGLLKWLAAQMRSDLGSGEEQQLRLESDARAVQIITIHKSKGLQFDVVFCPFTWTGTRQDSQLTTFHNPDDEERWTMALGPDIPPRYLRQGLREALAENLRLLYVALTRARQRCYWVWGRIRNTEYSAPAHLLHGLEDPSSFADWPEALAENMGLLTDIRFQRDLQALALRSHGTIALETLPMHDRQLASADRSLPLGDARVFKRVLDNRWCITSFSSLAADHEAADRENDSRQWVIEPSEKDRDTMSGVAAISGNTAVEHPVFGFPKGTRAGLFFHDLLENWDFNVDTETPRQALIASKLEAYGFESHWLAVVDRLLCDLAAAKLPNPWSSFCLGEISGRRRINEMAFHFPLKPISADQLRRAFASSSKSAAADRGRQTALKQLDFAPVEGFLKGYVDQVFEHQGRFYIVDWKSNHLGDRLEAYAPGPLQQVICDEFYFLQYHLYVVAVDQWLRLKIPDYDYTRHFGGVFYIFLRGIQPGAGHNGLFYDRPDAEVLERLRNLFLTHVK